MSSWIFFLLALTICPGAHSIRFATTSPTDGEILNVCVNDKLVLPWTLLLTSADVLDDIKWYFTDHTQTKEMIAISANGMFLQVPAYAARLHVLNTSGLELSHMTAEDAGNYTMEAVSHDSSGKTTTMQRSVHVDVGGGLQTTDGELHVTYNPTAVPDSTGQWSVQLDCGTFTFLASPPFNVQWRFPSGRTITGTSYKNGHFTLWLSAPVEGGNYTCRIPEESSQNACLHGDNDKAEATLHVDGTEARLVLLEAHQAALQKQNDLLKTENSHLKDNLTQQLRQQHLFQEETSQLRDNLTHQQQALQQTNTALAQLNSTQGRHVSFHARGLQNAGPSSGDTMIVPTVLTNEGNAYNSSTGYFTAPYSGTYFFAVTSGSLTTNKYARFDLLVDGTLVAYGKTTDPGPGESTSIHAVVHVAQGLRVWLRAGQSVDYYSSVTSFSGFLLYSD
ncbi:hypothetical protein V1264_002001 [Littorina saxatilis]